MRGASPRSGSSLFSFGATVLILHVPRFACWGNGRDVLSAGRVCGVGSSSVRSAAPVAVHLSRYLPCPFRITCRVRGASISSVRGASANGGVHRASACRVSGDGASTLSLSQASVVEQDTLRRSPL